MDAVASRLIRRSLLISLVLAWFLPASHARAVTVTYVNAGPADSRVFVGFFNNASGNTTSDFIADPAAYSRNDTLYGPLPPVGDLPNYDAMAYSGAELGTNLNAPLGSGVRSVFAPFNPTFFRAHGLTLAATGSYSANAFAHSGDTTSVVPTHWIVHVDPSGAEVAGTPANVTVAGSIAGYVSAAGVSVADAFWNVSTTPFGTVMTGSANQSVTGTTNFTDAGSLTFSVPLGSTFDLLVDYDLAASGNGAGADSTAEITASLVEISVVIPPPVPPAFSTSVLKPIGNLSTAASPAGPFRKKQIIPIRFRLSDAKGVLISDEVAQALDARIAVFLDLPGGGGTPIDLVDSPPQIGDRFRYQRASNSFVHNLRTKSDAWIAGQRYRVEILIDGNKTAEAFFTLR